MISYYYAIIIFIIIIALYNTFTWNVSAYEDYLYGFWVANNDEFCAASEIESMLFFVGESSDNWFTRERTCYLIIMNNFCNQGLTLTYKTGWAGIGIGKYQVIANVEFDEEQLWDNPVSIYVDMKSGEMKIHGPDDTLYAKLSKQHDTTNLTRDLEDAELVTE